MTLLIELYTSQASQFGQRDGHPPSRPSSTPCHPQGPRSTEVGPSSWCGSLTVDIPPEDLSTVDIGNHWTMYTLRPGSVYPPPEDSLGEVDHSFKRPPSNLDHSSPSPRSCVLPPPLPSPTRPESMVPSHHPNRGRLLL